MILNPLEIGGKNWGKTEAKKFCIIDKQTIIPAVNMGSLFFTQKPTL